MINPDFKDLFSTLNDAEVRYLVVGAYAVTFHTRPRFTKDLDVWADPEVGNAERTLRALAAFGAPVAELGAGDLAQEGMVFQMGVAPNRIDLVTSIDGVEFAPAWSRRCAWEYGGVPVHVLSREDLLVNKRVVDRPQDRLDVIALEQEG